MFFHLPLAIPWHPVPICERLVRCDVDAKLVEDAIHISVSSDASEAMRKRHAKRIQRRGIGGPDACIRFHPDRFIRNVELHREIFVVPRSDPALVSSTSLLQETGAIMLDSDDDEFAIAHQHCEDRDKIEQLRTELELHEAKKRHYADLFEFENASKAWQLAQDTRSKLDTLLFHSQ